MAGKKDIFATKEELENKYLETKSIYKIAEFYNKNYKTIMSLMNDYGIKRITGSQGARKHYYNDDYFKVIDTENKAYWLGFLMADGCIYKGSNGNSLRLQINLSRKDEVLLHQFQKNIGSDYKIQQKILKEKYEVSILKINSTAMCQDLIGYGITERKSLLCEFPEFLQNHYLTSHFIRGYFDGDGCINISKRKDYDRAAYTFNIVGGKQMLETIQSYLPGTNLYILKKRNHIVTLESGKKDTILFIKDYLYKNANIYLQRKKDIFDAIK